MYAIFSPQVGLNDSGDCKTQQPRILQAEKISVLWYSSSKQFRLRVLIAFKGFLRKGYLCRDAYNSPRRQQPNAATQRSHIFQTLSFWLENNNVLRDLEY
ncbi:uncharacterized protein [Lolium perenne]|uniref:uncharacterized protein isoform X1 n=1 Tax=Lolium perenne TaxID=4522 RepID=UPI003A99F35C